MDPLGGYFLTNKVMNKILLTDTHTDTMGLNLHFRPGEWALNTKKHLGYNFCDFPSMDYKHCGD